MAKYMIHAVPERMWYVKEHLLKSLENQGISCYDLSVYCDENKEGNLTAFVKSLKLVTEDTWHLQDDVILASNFAEVTKKITEGIACGFCSSYSKAAPAGLVIPANMWYSFPCIRIPKTISDEFLDWLENEAPKNAVYKSWIKSNKFDDSLFMEFMMRVKKEVKVLNVKPNLIDHVDYLIGGSLLNGTRDYHKSMSIYFEEPELIEELRRQINGKFRSE